jgi:hypothetical protein
MTYRFWVLVWSMGIATLVPRLAAASPAPAQVDARLAVPFVANVMKRILRLARTDALCKIVLTGLLAAGLSLAGPSVAAAGINIWTSHGPYEVSVSALAIDPTTPSTLYAGTNGGGVFQSTNSGGSWSPVNSGLSGGALTVYALAIDPSTPSTLYAGTEEGLH